MAFALFIVHTILRLAVDIRGSRSFSCHIGIRISRSFLEAVAASLPGLLGIAPADLDPVQVTQEILIVPACLYGTF